MNLGIIILIIALTAFLVASCVGLGRQSWKSRRHLMAWLLLLPNLLLILCYIPSLLDHYHVIPGYSLFNWEFVAGLFLLFMIPVSAITTPLAILLFLFQRKE